MFGNDKTMKDIFDAYEKAFSYTNNTKSKLTETDNGYVYKLLVPGCGEGDVSVKLRDNVINIYAKSKVEHFESKIDDAIRITNKIDTSKISAKVKNGILTIDLPYSNDSVTTRDIL